MIKLKNSTLLLFLLAVVVCLVGVLSIYSSTYQKEGASDSVYQRQLLWIALGFAVYAALAHFHYRRLWDAAYILYVLAVLLLALVYVLGAVRLGAQRWLSFMWFNFQPSEIAKLIIVIVLARYFSRKTVDSVSLVVNNSGIIKGLAVPFALIIIPTAFVIEQPDLGSGAMILAVFIVMVYLSGLRFRYIALFIAVGALVVPLLWIFLRDYQKARLLVFLDPNIDPLGAGYTVIQSKIAIGSGGFFGKGWLSGTQSQLRFLPESHTDFIFATFAEEWGLFGSLVLLSLYFLLIWQGIRIGLRTHDSFGRLLAFGISLMLGLQVFTNIAMNMGLAPVVGLPLPLMSYGGSSVLTTFAALGILANIDKTRGVF